MTSVYGGLSDFTNLEVPLFAIWIRETDTPISPLAPLFNIVNSNNAQEVTQGMSTFEFPQLDTGTLPYADVAPLGRVEFKHDRYSSAFRIPIDFFNDNNVNAQAAIVRNHAMSFNEWVAEEMAGVFNNAFGTTVYKAEDGKALCATGRNTGKATLNNTSTSFALSYANVTTARRTMRKFTNAKGRKVGSNPDTLVVPPDLYQTAVEIAMSPMKPGVDTNDVNMLRGMNQLNVIEDIRLTDADNWFLIDSMKAQRHLWWFWRERPNVARDPRGMFENAYIARGTMRYSLGPDDFTWVYGGQG